MKNLTSGLVMYHILFLKDAFPFQAVQLLATSQAASNVCLTYMHRSKQKLRVPRAFAEWRFWRTAWIREISFYEKLAKPKTTKIGMSIDLHITIATRESAKRKHHKHLIEHSKENAHKFWNAVKKIFPFNSKSSPKSTAKKSETQSMVNNFLQRVN